jgi:hypothetical protein
VAREYRHFGVPEPVLALAVLLALMFARIAFADLLDYLLRKGSVE